MQIASLYWNLNVAFLYVFIYYYIYIYIYIYIVHISISAVKHKKNKFVNYLLFCLLSRWVSDLPPWSLPQRMNEALHEFGLTPIHPLGSKQPPCREKDVPWKALENEKKGAYRGLPFCHHLPSRIAGWKFLYIYIHIYIYIIPPGFQWAVRLQEVGGIFFVRGNCSSFSFCSLVSHKWSWSTQSRKGPWMTSLDSD